MNTANPQVLRAIWQQNGKYVVILTSGFVLCFHFFWVWKYAVNIPYWDDFDSILQFLNNYLGSNTFAEKFDLITRRHNEHRIVVNRLVTLFQYYVLGAVNFKGQIFLGNFFVFVFFITACLSFRRRAHVRWIEFLPVPFIIFNINGFEAFLWPMVSVGTFGVILFSFLSIFLLFSDVKINDNVKFFGALFAATLATFTNGNGFLALIICFIGLVVQKTNYRYIIFWGIAASVVLLLNFKGYKPIPYHPDAFKTLVDQPDQLISHFFILLGNFFQTYGPFNYPLVLFTGSNLRPLQLSFGIVYSIFHDVANSLLYYSSAYL
jgi:hypothetical protein